MAKVIRKGKLNSLPARLENAQNRALIESGMLVSQRATQRAPVDTGRLKRSITFTPPRVIGFMRSVIAVGTNVSYAAFQEFGTKYMKAQPYLNPALEASRKDIAKIMAKNIKAAFKN